jgi:hypothetical protein
MNINFDLRKICIILLSVTVLCGISCRKYLYQGPIDSTYSGVFWTSQASVEQAAANMYFQLRNDVRGSGFVSNAHFINGDLTTGVFLPKAADWNLVTIESSYNPPFYFSYVPYLEPMLQDWSRFYQLIAQTNLILQNVPNMDNSAFTSETVKNGYLGEALFMRAYTYFYVTRIWGDPVYVTRTYDGSDYGNIPPLPRTPEAQVLDSCIRDLRLADSYLDYAGGDPARSIRANKGSVEALMAHIFEWQHQYDSAHVYCQKVIQNGGYALEPMASYTNIWAGQSSAESIFEIAMTYSANDPNFLNSQDGQEANFGFFSTFVKGAVTDNQSNDCWIAQPYWIESFMYDTANDARFKTIFTHVNADNNNKDGYMLLKYTNFAFGTPGATPGTGSLPYINNDLVLLRLSDIYLLDAEALSYLGDYTQAEQSLAMTEERAGIDSYDGLDNRDDLLDEVVMERFRELIGEGQWFYDLIRNTNTNYGTQWLTDFMGYTEPGRVSPQNKGYYWPLNMGTLFPQDDLLTQNPWWAVNK